MLHPVGDLPASVYWRRRLLLIGLLLTLVVGGVWVAVATVTGGGGGESGGSGAAGTPASTATPALEQVLPSLASVQIPTAAPTTVAPETEAALPTTAPPPVPAGPVDGSPCTDDMISVDVVPEPPTASVGSKPTFQLVVTNTSPVSCVRSLDKGLQEILLLDGAGNRVWGSNDCFPEQSSEQRSLAPGEAVRFPVLWSGKTSEPSCQAARPTPAAGAYVLRGRLDTKVGADAPFTLV